MQQFFVARVRRKNGTEYLAYAYAYGDDGAEIRVGHAALGEAHETLKEKHGKEWRTYAENNLLCETRGAHSDFELSRNEIRRCHYNKAGTKIWDDPRGITEFPKLQYYATWEISTVTLEPAPEPTPD